MNILGKLKGIRKEKLDTEQAKSGVSWVVRVAQAVGAVVVLGLIIWVIVPPKVENPAPVVVEKEVQVTVEVEKPVVQTVVVEKEVAKEIVPSPTPVPPTVTPVPPTQTPSPVVTIDVDSLVNQLHKSWAEKDWQTVIDLVEQILVAKPGDEEFLEKLYAAHVNYGNDLANAGRFGESMFEYNFALNIKPGGKEAQQGFQRLHGLAQNDTVWQKICNIAQSEHKRDCTLYPDCRQSNDPLRCIIYHD